MSLKHRELDREGTQSDQATTRALTPPSHPGQPVRASSIADVSVSFLKPLSLCTGIIRECSLAC